jgi:hypothetical protein
MVICALGRVVCGLEGLFAWKKGLNDRFWASKPLFVRHSPGADTGSIRLRFAPCVRGFSLFSGSGGPGLQCSSFSFLPFLGGFPGLCEGSGDSSLSGGDSLPFASGARPYSPA